MSPRPDPPSSAAGSVDRSRLPAASQPAESARAAARARSADPARPGEPVRITPHRDGPLIVRGPFLLTDQDGNEVALDRSPVALCRCGRSRSRPFCDGSHALVRFRAPSAPESR